MIFDSLQESEASQLAKQFGKAILIQQLTRNWICNVSERIESYGQCFFSTSCPRISICYSSIKYISPVTKKFLLFWYFTLDKISPNLWNRLKTPECFLKASTNDLNVPNLYQDLGFREQR